jgi:hypothetical protein
MSLSFVDLFDWEKENDVQYYALLAHKKDIDDWYQETEETAEIVVNKPKLLAHEDDNTTSSLFRLQKKDIVLI